MQRKCNSAQNVRAACVAGSMLLECQLTPRVPFVARGLPCPVCDGRYNRYCLYFSLFGGSFGHSMRWRHHKLRGIALSEPLKPAAVILDFRHCVKQIIYGSIEAGYYAGVLPIRFLLNRHAVFDKRTCLLVVIFVFLNTLTLLMANMLSTCSKVMPHAFAREAHDRGGVIPPPVLSL